MKERLLRKDSTWARDFNPRKLKPVNNFKIMDIVDKVERTKKVNEEERDRLELELLKRKEPIVHDTASRRVMGMKDQMESRFISHNKLSQFHDDSTGSDS